MSSKPTGKRYSQDQILHVLQQARTGTKVSDLCRSHGISEATFHRWKGRYDGMSHTELAKAKQAAPNGDNPSYARAAEIFEEMSTSEQFAEFLTLPLYEEI